MIGCVEPRELDDAEKSLYSEIMAKAAPVIRAAANRLIPNGSVQEFRRQLNSGNLSEITPEEVQAVSSVKDIEYPVLQGYCCLIPNVVERFYQRERRHKSAIERDDYIQEGLCAISDAMYVYDGESKFTTYATAAIYGRIVDYVRRDAPLSPIKRRVVKLRAEINEILKSGKTFEQATQELGLTDDEVQECRESSVGVTSGPDEGWDDFVSSFSFVNFNGVDFLEVDGIRKALEIANLSELERDVLETVLEGGTKSEAAKRHNKSRMAGTYAYDRALKIVKDTYEQLVRAA